MYGQLVCGESRWIRTSFRACGATISAQLLEPDPKTGPITSSLRKNLVVGEDGYAVLDGTDPMQAIPFLFCTEPDAGTPWRARVTLIIIRRR